MDKTISITIAGLIFHVEEAAYSQLESYLSSVRKHFSVYDDSEEIIRDIENRIAEIFTQRTDYSKKAVATADVGEVIRQIGTIEDFEHFEGVAKEASKESEEGSSTASKRLFRDPDNSILGGVAAGVSAYLGIDVTIIRLLFILFAIAWGVSILIYLVLWVVMPSAKTTAQKLQMKGEPITLASLEEKIKAKVPPKQEISSAAGRLLYLFAGLLRDLGEGIILFIRKALPVMLNLIGIALIVIGGLVAVLLTVLFIVILTSAPNAWPGLTFSQFASGPVNHYLLLTSSYLLIVIPVLLILMAGLALLGSKKRIRSAPAAVVMLSVWVFALLMAGIIGLREMSAYQGNKSDYNLGLEQHEQTFDVAEYSVVSISGGQEVSIVPSEVYFVRAFGDEQVLDHQLQVQVSGRQLTISNKRVCIFLFDTSGKAGNRVA
ncbi:MAG: PspC domain-containing protein [Balneolales bacterium]